MKAWLRRLEATRLRRLLHRWLPLLGWMGLIYFLSSRPDLPHPSVGWLSEALNRTGHVVEYAVLALLWARVLNLPPRRWPLAFGLTMLYALSDEYHQSFVPGRHADLMDLLWDALGASLGLGLWVWWKRRSAASPSPE
jgi:VanZ family protein